MHDQVALPRDQIVENFLGKPLMEDRKLYFESSPISYATRANNQTSFFLAWGTADDIAEPATQSEAFMLALEQAGFFVRPARSPPRRISGCLILSMSLAATLASLRRRSQVSWRTGCDRSPG
jgi:hypothetical protein